MKMRAGSQARDTDTRTWLAHQVGQYEAMFPQYRRFAALLQEVLQRTAGALAPLAIVQSRPKSITSFAEKALRKRDKYDNPVRQLTDLCGARVIARTRSEVDGLSEFIKENFDVDWANSLDCSQRLGPSEFGYRSVHYIVSFRSDKGEAYGISVPKRVLPMKAEVQLRTVVEHAYADFAHDLTYKGAFDLPLAWRRELAGAAASLEQADQTFSRIEDRLREYATSYGGYLGQEELRREVELLGTVLGVDPGNAKLAARLGQLAQIQGDWDKAREVLEPFVDPKKPEGAPQPILRELGLTYAKNHPPGSARFKRGQRYLEIAARPEHGDVDAICSLAGTWKKIDAAKAREHYRRAFETDPYDTYALGNYLEQELEHNPGVLAGVRPLLQKAIERCRAHADARVNLPWAYYDMGKFHLLMDEPYESLDAYAKALTVSSAPFMIETSLSSLDHLHAVGANFRGYEWVRRLLLLGLAARFPSAGKVEAVRRMATKPSGPVRPPVLIVGGGTDPRFEKEMCGYAGTLLPALGRFVGTLISGGTTQGISGLVGDAARAGGERIRAIGYLPDMIPKDATKDGDPTRYREIRHTGGIGFTPLEPLQNWIDLLASGVEPDQVRLLGIGGGKIAAAEYRIALALGARVGLVAGSGREADRIFTDPHWATSEALLALPSDVHAIQAFGDWKTSVMPEEVSEPIARAIHEAYRQERFDSGRLSELALSDWQSLRENYKQSNRDQAVHMGLKLEAIGCTYQRVGASPAEFVEKGDPSATGCVELTPEEIEVMARMEHGRWVVERMLAGWKPGKKRDLEKKTSPFLVGWSELAEEVRELDRQTVRKIPQYLAQVGFTIQRVR